MSMPSPWADARDVSESSSPSTIPVLHLDITINSLSTLLQESVPIERADQVMEYAHIQRQLEFQWTVRRYLTQILYGCEQTFCTTPMCRSSQLRVKNTPFRPPTVLTARMLAYYLATQDDPTSALCPHKLKCDPAYLGFGYDITLHMNHRAGLGTRSIGVIKGVDTTSTVQEKTNTESSEATRKAFWREMSSRHTTKKDTLSLAQNLFDTTASIFFYFKNLPDHAAMTRDFMTSGHLEFSGPKKMLTSGVVPSGNARGHGRSSSPSNSRHKNDKHDQEHRRVQSSRKEKSTKLKLRDKTRQDKVPNPTTKDKMRLNGSLESHQHSKPDRPQKRMNGSATFKNNRVPAIDAKSIKVSAPSQKSAPSPATTSRNPRIEIRSISTLNIDMMETLIKATPISLLGTLDGWEASGVTSMCSYDTRASAPAFSLANRSLHYVLSDADRLLQSFKNEVWSNGGDSPLPHLVPEKLSRVFRGWSERNGSLVFDSLWFALEALFRPPPELIKEQKSPRLRSAQRKPSSETNGDRFYLDGSTRSTSHSTGQSNGTSKLHDSKPKGSSSEERYLSDSEAAHIVMICIHALTSHVPEGVPDVWQAVRTRFLGVNFKVKRKQANLDLTLEPWISVVDALEYEPALRLAERLFRAIAARRCFSQIIETLREKKEFDLPPDDGTLEIRNRIRSFDLMQIVCEHLKEVEKEAAPVRFALFGETNEQGWSISSVLLEWLRTVCIKRWKREPVVNRWGAVGAAMDIMWDLANFAPACTQTNTWLLHEPSKHDSLGLHPEMFHMPYFFNYLDKAQTSSDFMDHTYNPNTVHLLSYISLFTPSERLLYFRTINYSKMFRSYEAAERRRCLYSMLDILTHRNAGWNWRAHRPFNRIFQRYLVLDVRRERALEDCFDQLWGLERNHLYNPLKVRIGALEGEDGVDQGGVTMEFFRVALAEAFDPQKGMFTLDSQTRMTWFKPASPAPLQQFELIGILFSLAIYNGITLPVTFPLIFYKYLLGNRKRTLIDLKDGWPDLYRSFRQVLTWDEGDVSDTFGGEFEFTYDNFGKPVRVNMITGRPLVTPSAHSDEASINETISTNGNPSTTNNHVETKGDQNGCPDPNEPPLVTNENRDNFVSAYLYWLMQASINPQLEAFLRGFRRCLDKKALCLFTPSELRTVVEGHQNVDIQGLRKVVQYEDGYTADHKTIHQFWEIVEQYDDDMKSKLLEFVTASDRVPVSGIGSVMFSIVRNGGDTEMLPTSSTCFGKLLLPEFASKEKLRSKLEIALHYAKGFGAV